MQAGSIAVKGQNWRYVRGVIYLHHAFWLKRLLSRDVWCLYSVVRHVLSRFAGGQSVYQDLSKDETLFQGAGDYQFDVYRQMQDVTQSVSISSLCTWNDNHLHCLLDHHGSLSFANICNYHTCTSQGKKKVHFLSFLMGFITSWCKLANLS